MNQNELNIDSIPLNFPSICISYANMNTTNTDVLNMFKKLNVGKIASIQFTVCTNNVSNERFYKIFIHFTLWFNKYNEIRIKLLNNETQYIIYNFPWFWKISKYKKSEKTSIPKEMNWRENKKKNSDNTNWRLR